MNRQLEQLDRLLQSYLTHANDLINTLSEREFYEKHSDWDTLTLVNLIDLIFHNITGENDFHDFYERFDAPFLAKGDKPIAWGPRFLPDLIQDQIISGNDIKIRAKKIRKLYDKCIKLERKFKPRKK